MDIVGFGINGVEVSVGKEYCSHHTRDITKNCECKPGFYDVGDGQQCPPCIYPCSTCNSIECLSIFY